MPNIKEPAYDEFDTDFLDFNSGDLMPDAFTHLAEAMKAEQANALELTKLALAHSKNADEEKVFELFERSAQLLQDIYRSPIEE